MDFSMAHFSPEAANILKQKCAITDACIKAQNVIKARNGEPVRAPADMTKPEKERMWEQHQIPNGPQL